METRYTVRFFKRVITFAVLALILCLAIAVVVLGIRVSRLSVDGANGVNGANGANGDAAVTDTADAPTTAPDADGTTAPAADTGEAPAPTAGRDLAYQALYPELCVTAPLEPFVPEKAKTVYLTFDDGPSETHTAEILDILKEYEVPATFFVVHHSGDYAVPMLRRMIDEGHTIGIHTYSHEFETVYQSEESFLRDFYRIWRYLKDEVGYEAEIFRFPGGSINSYDLRLYDPLIREMYRRGFLHYDWNASAEDAVTNGASRQTIVRDVLREVRRNKRSIVLMHDSDGMDTTVEALPEIIRTLQKEGYTFRALDRSVQPMSFAEI